MFYIITGTEGPLSRVEAHNTDLSGNYGYLPSVPNVQRLHLPTAHAARLVAASDSTAPKLAYGTFAADAHRFVTLVALQAEAEFPGIGWFTEDEIGGTGVYGHQVIWRLTRMPVKAERITLRSIIKRTLADFPHIAPYLQARAQFIIAHEEDVSMELCWSVPRTTKARLWDELTDLRLWGEVDYGL